ncbi:hypothetical protein J6590_036249 [Homalodisca vitripennis]|nr:hypothetical protein J6590_036249 [Homalodisca vitripennis]
MTNRLEISSGNGDGRLRKPGSSPKDFMSRRWTCISWHSDNRGSHALVDITSRGGLLYPMKRIVADSEDSQYRSWRWDLVTTKLFVDGIVHNGWGDRCYPLQQNEERYTVPDKFHGKFFISFSIVITWIRQLTTHYS